MGDEVRAEAKQRGLQPTPENVGKVMLQIRAEDGPEVLARRCIPKIRASDSSVVIIDGIRSMHEVQEYRKEFPKMRVMAVHASPKTRFRRLTKRGRSDDPQDWTTFVERDQRELGVGLGDVVATADLVVINEGTIEDFKNKLRYLLKRKFRV